MAKIAIASAGKTLASPVDPRFGRCPYYVIVDSEAEEYEAVENTAGQAFHGAGITAAQLVADQGVEAIVAGNFGPKAVAMLGQAGLKLYCFTDGTVKEALDAYREGGLAEYADSGGRGQCR